jgi:hypothetical protein
MSLSPRRTHAIVSVLLVVLIGITFADVRRNAFVNYDDPCYILDNENVRDGLDAGDLPWALTSRACGNWHPLTWLVHAVEVELFGLNPGAHHLAGLAWHAAAAVALFLALASATGATWRSALVAALFAVHPLHVQSVAWVSERKDLVSALLAFLTIGGYVAWTRTPSARRRAAMLALYAAGLMAKPMLVTLPLVLLLLDLWPLGRLTRAEWKGRVVEKGPLFAMAAASSVMTLLVQRAAGAVGTMDEVPLALRLANAVTSVWVYVVRTIHPVGLSFLYPFDLDIPAGIVAAAALAFVGATAGALFVARRAPWATVGWLWYVGTLVPVIGIVQVGMQANADRYTYLPSVGLFILVAWGGEALVRRTRIPPISGAAAAITAVIACAAASHAETRWWKDSETLFRRGIAVTEDNGLAQYYLAKELARAGKDGEAVVHYAEAARLLPPHTDLHFNFGNALMRLGRASEAVPLYEHALALAPGDDEIRLALAGALARAGRRDAALARLQEVLLVHPGDAKAQALLEWLKR